MKTIRVSWMAILRKINYKYFAYEIFINEKPV